MSAAPDPPPPQQGCVLAGGRSSRMGHDKATLPCGTRPMIAHMVAKLESAGCAQVIAGSRPDLAAYGHVLADLHPGCGPLAGIEAALQFALDQTGASPDEPVLFVPVDLPLLPPTFLTLLLERARRTGAAATIPLANGRPQPLCAVYRCSLLPDIRASLASGNYKVMAPLASLAAGLTLDLFSVEGVLSASLDHAPALPAYSWFANINTPRDLQDLERRAEFAVSPAK